MNYRELITQLTLQRGAGEARAIVRMVMEERFGLSQTDLLLGKDTTLSADDRTEFEKIAFRLLSGEPVQYVLGFADFCGHRFSVNSDVLIPRPETAELVRWVIDDHPHSPSPKILDLCTGSGCIAITLALAFPAACVVGADISSEALAVARKNAHVLGASNVEFIQQDILKMDDFRHTSFSILISNPPYVRAIEAKDMERTVLDYEPHQALFVPDDDSLRFYHAISNIAQRTLLPNGFLYVEINAALAEETRQIFLTAGFRDVILRNDQFNHPRMLRATR